MTRTNRVLSAKILFLVHDAEVVTVLLLSSVKEFVFELVFVFDKEFDKSLVRELDNVPSNKFVKVFVSVLAKSFVKLFVAEPVFELVVIVFELFAAAFKLPALLKKFLSPLFASHCIEAVANLFSKTFLFIILLPCCYIKIFKAIIYYSRKIFLTQKRTKSRILNFVPLLMPLCKL